MNTILELREKRNNVWNTAKAFLDTNRGADGMVSAEAAAQYEKMEADMVNLGKEIDRLERQAAYDLELNKATTQAVTNAPTQQAEAPKTERASNEYREDFKNILRGKNPIHNVLSTTPDADGGYLVPVEFERRIVMGLDEANVIRRIAKVITTAAERKIPIAATHSVAKWTAENAAITESNPTFAQKTIDAYKLTNLIKVSMELLQDSMFDLEAYIAAEFSRAFGIAEEEAFCIGDGTDRPTGIFLPTGGGTIGVTTTAAAINTDNLIDLVYALKSPYRRNASFLMRDITVSAIRKLKDNNGQYLWQPSMQTGTV
jgi:HK97 family phage major capsid protein